MPVINLSGLGDTIMSDTVGVVYRAATGKVDPWTTAEINNQAAQAKVDASGGTVSFDDALAQAQQDSTAIQSNQLSWWQSAQKSFGSDDGSGCTIANISGCVGFDLSWAPYVLAIGGVLVVLWILGPYVGLLEER